MLRDIDISFINLSTVFHLACTLKVVDGGRERSDMKTLAVKEINRIDAKHVAVDVLGLIHEKQYLLIDGVLETKLRLCDFLIIKFFW